MKQQDAVFDSIVSYLLSFIFYLILLPFVLRLINFYFQNTAFGSANFIDMDGNNNSESFFDDFMSFAEVGANAEVFQNLDMQLQKESEDKTKEAKRDAVSYI